MVVDVHPSWHALGVFASIAGLAVLEAIGRGILAPLFGMTDDVRIEMVLAAIFFAGSIGAAVLYLRVARIRLTSEHLQYRWLVGVTRTIPLDTILIVMFAPVIIDAREKTYGRIAVIGRDSRVKLRVRVRYWDDEDLDLLIDALGSRVRTISGPIDHHDFVRDYPSMSLWPERHPYSFLAIVLGALVAAVAAFVLVVVA
jgi:hypothetical protein